MVRYRRSRGTERDQLKLLAFAAATVAASYLVIIAALDRVDQRQHTGVGSERRRP